ncbi:MAG: hypothetical protein DHS20C15_27890 [Planctomycetota bacterium]|nr:MAG: hypothetical protein DHS20C15_27890 [Planctomycetota bacterium]
MSERREDNKLPGAHAERSQQEAGSAREHEERVTDPEGLTSDIVDVLGAAWREQRAPDATPTLAASDAATRDSVRWMQDSWAQLQAPPVEVPAALRQRVQRGRAPVLAWRRHAAAAALLLSVGLALRFGAGWLPPRALVDRGRDLGPSQDVAHDSDRPRLVAAHADHIELRSGPVRLLLVTATESPPHDTNPSFGSDLR